MSLPKRFSIGPGNNEVGIIGRREAHQFLPFRFIGIDRDNVALFLNRNAFPYAVNNQRANQRWRALKDRQTEIGDASVTTVIGRDFFTPNLAYFAALLREAHDEDQELLAAAVVGAVAVEQAGQRVIADLDDAGRGPVKPVPRRRASS